MRKLLGLGIFVCGIASAHAQVAVPTDDFICQVRPSERVDVASPVAGVIESLFADRGDRVKKGQPLVALRADTERADVALAQVRADSIAQVKSKEASLAFAQRKYDRNVEMRRNNLISENDLDQLATEKANAALDLEAARDSHHLAELELARAKALLDLRTIHSPIDGVVTERNLPPGNLVSEKPVMVLVKTDPLYVEVSLPSTLFGKVHPGMSAHVTFELPGVMAKDVEVKLTDGHIDPASDTFGARLVLANPAGDVPAGAKCHVVLNGVGL